MPLNSAGTRSLARGTTRPRSCRESLKSWPMALRFSSSQRVNPENAQSARLHLGHLRRLLDHFCSCPGFEIASAESLTDLETCISCCHFRTAALESGAHCSHLGRRSWFHVDHDGAIVGRATKPGSLG